MLVGLSLGPSGSSRCLPLVLAGLEVLSLLPPPGLLLVLEDPLLLRLTLWLMVLLLPLSCLLRRLARLLAARGCCPGAELPVCAPVLAHGRPLAEVQADLILPERILRGLCGVTCIALCVLSNARCLLLLDNCARHRRCDCCAFSGTPPVPV